MKTSTIILLFCTSILTCIVSAQTNIVRQDTHFLGLPVLEVQTIDDGEPTFDYLRMSDGYSVSTISATCLKRV